MQTINPLTLLDKLAGRWLDWRVHQLAKSVQPETFDFGIKSLTAKEAKIEIIGIAPGIAFLADEAVALLNKTNAPNSVQFDMFPRVDHATRPVRVTVAWADGEMPNAKAARLEAENVRLRTALEKYADPDNWEISEEEIDDIWALTYSGRTLAEIALKPESGQA